MNTKLRVLVATVIACITVASCGGDDKKATVTSTPINTARALDKARVPLDNNEPEETNAGAVSFNDVSDTAEPIEVNAQ